MLRALYDFEAPYEGTLTFGENEQFVVLKRHNKDNNWVHVINDQGIHGYAPANYLAEADCDLVKEMEFIDRVLNRMTAKKRPAGDHKVVLENLLEIRANLEGELEQLAAKQVYELASIVRQSTKCTFQDAQVAATASLDYIRRHVAPIPLGLERISKIDWSRVSLEIRRKDPDCRRLEELIETVMETASDRETQVDLETWDDLLDVVTHADPVLCAWVLERHDCAVILRLIQRLQAEICWRKRRPILSTLFHGLQLSRVFLNVALNSILAAELARDIEATARGTPNKDRLDWSVRLLTLTLCSEELISFEQQSQLGRNFVGTLLDILEAESVSIATAEERDEGPDLAGHVFNLILALHLQFQRSYHEENAVLMALGDAEQVKTTFLVEKTILLYNREEDPLEQYRRDGASDSVSCFIFGLFSSSQTARLFYTADLEVLHDVMLRQLTDYGPGDKRRTNALELLKATSRIGHVPYRSSEFASCLKDICTESRRLGCSTPEMDHDRCLVLKIYHEFPHLLMQL